MTRSELVAALGERLPPQTADQAVRTILDCMGSALTQGRRVEIRGFGSFSLRQHGARIGRNPRSGETVHVPAKRVAAFKPGKALRERVGEEKTLFA